MAMKTTIVLVLIHFSGSQQTIEIYTAPSMEACHIIADAYKGPGQALCQGAPEWTDGGKQR